MKDNVFQTFGFDCVTKCGHKCSQELCPYLKPEYAKELRAWLRYYKISIGYEGGKNE